ncbi:glycoside hydrolase family 20 protein [Carboxylicivirga sp. N1Y90]|uniref:glycoside hydrolase family 20 protein n=1 Tax=Carboxylicivirga fragile TaxID=3417571 RepID=UPI003D330AAE|nr:family 20 glycosylhydrolase [Marinilabiliaceae bacterium N1Y90]
MYLRNLITFLILFACLKVVANQSVDIIPKPVSLQMYSGSFEITEKTSIQFNSRQTELEQAAHFLSDAIESISGIQLSFNEETEHQIQLKLTSANMLGDEGYNLNVSADGIVLEANAKAGVIYGMQSILQMLPAVRTNAKLIIPCLAIEDYPRFKWRGMHLDVSRHFFGPDVIKQYIDLMASYKMNVFHWHLIDDQGWRIEIKQYPKLTDVGAWRVDYNHLVWDKRPQAKPGEEPTYGGYYTQEQIKEIINYAAERNVTIVPEIEMPGHIASAIAAYPEYCCTQKPQLPLTGGNYTNMSSNYCAGNDAVFTFLENVLNEVLELFPSEYIHIGGDEVNKNSWKKCELCQQRMKDENLKDENELQSYFIKRIEKFLISKNRKMIGWDEILEGGLAPEATVMSWRGEAGGIEAAKMGHDVVMTPGKPCYFDHYQAGPTGEPLAIGGFNTLKTVYDYEPIPHELSTDNAHFVLGAQGNVWTEYMTTVEHLEYMVLPRMAALAEVVWTPKSNKDWDSFNKRINSQFNAYEQKGLNFCRGNATVAFKPISHAGNLSVEMSTEVLDGEIVYTLDGQDPTLKSKAYNEAIKINSTAVLKASVIANGVVVGTEPSSQNFVMHKGIGCDVLYTNPVSTYYLADGPNSLTDGIRGNGTVGKFWHAFNENDLVATLDMGEIKSISDIKLGCLQKYRDWIFMPKEVVFEVSVDGKKFKEVGRVVNPIDANEAELVYDFKTFFKAKKVRYVRVIAKANVCPPGHNGAGKPSWIFADEIMIK